MLVNHEPKASDFKSSPNTPSGLSLRKLSQKSFVGFHMARDDFICRGTSLDFVAHSRPLRGQTRRGRPVASLITPVNP